MATTLVLLLGGLPGAGKSSLARALQEALSPQIDFTMLEYDDMEETLLWEIVGNSDNSEETDRRLEAWRQTRKLALERLRQLLSDQSSPHKTNEDDNNNLPIRQIILMDDNYYLRSMRKQVYLTCQQQLPLLHEASAPSSSSSSSSSSNTSLAMVTLWLDTPLDDCRARNAARSRPIPEAVLQRMAQHMEVPATSSEVVANDTGTADSTTNSSNGISSTRTPHWERVVWHFNGKQPVAANVGQLKERLLQPHLVHTWLPEALVPPPIDPEIEARRLAAARAETRRSMRHQIDQALRRAVPLVLRYYNDDRRAAASVANAVRKQVLGDVHIENTVQALQLFVQLFGAETSPPLPALDAQHQEQLRRAILQLGEGM